MPVLQKLYFNTDEGSFLQENISNFSEFDFLKIHSGLCAPDQANWLLVVFRAHKEMSIPSFTSSSDFSNSSTTKSLVLFKIWSGKTGKFLYKM